MLNYVESVESETAESVSGDQLTREAIETSEPDEDSQTMSRHEVIRQLAREQVQRNVELIRNVMTKRGRRVVQDYHVDDIVGLGIPAPDRQRLGRRLLPCKVVEALDGGWYRLGCSQGILDIHYQAADLEPVEAEYSELEDIPETTISLTAVIRGQSINDESSSCNCRTNCSTRRCPCRRADNVCSLNCHHRNNDCINN